ncbi:hypothetical protein [Chryseobacterium sp. 5_R23647]|uniref:hypothetical protein n=1 Tax=Chryseobacterium sp. 5_R23647 TaxID=2258964 RepID=UPI000E243253|nr:hypothetical protein [Chryseobacterium sp. 5_R23647]REC40490.1 hypothetical protein DRF69_18525 [Chryseobacterium sp. 5_R23647]
MKLLDKIKITVAERNGYINNGVTNSWEYAIRKVSSNNKIKLYEEVLLELSKIFDLERMISEDFESLEQYDISDYHKALDIIKIFNGENYPLWRSLKDLPNKQSANKIIDFLGLKFCSDLIGLNLQRLKTKHNFTTEGINHLKKIQRNTVTDSDISQEDYLQSLKTIEIFQRNNPEWKLFKKGDFSTRTWNIFKSLELDMIFYNDLNNLKLTEIMNVKGSGKAVAKEIEEFCINNNISLENHEL